MSVVNHFVTFIFSLVLLILAESHLLALDLPDDTLFICTGSLYDIGQFDKYKDQVLELSLRIANSKDNRSLGTWSKKLAQIPNVYLHTESLAKAAKRFLEFSKTQTAAQYRRRSSRLSGLLYVPEHLAALGALQVARDELARLFFEDRIPKTPMSSSRLRKFSDTYLESTWNFYFHQNEGNLPRTLLDVSYEIHPYLSAHPYSEFKKLLLMESFEILLQTLEAKKVLGQASRDASHRELLLLDFLRLTYAFEKTLEVDFGDGNGKKTPSKQMIEDLEGHLEIYQMMEETIHRPIEAIHYYRIFEVFAYRPTKHVPDFSAFKNNFKRKDNGEYSLNDAELAALYRKFVALYQ